MQLIGNKITRKIFRSFGYDIKPLHAAYFHTHEYLRHTARRLEHLESLRLPVAGKSILEVGAGIGEQSHYYIDRGCRITITEARQDNLRYLKDRYPDQDVRFLDMERPSALDNAPFDIVHCYGLLYHLKDPEAALKFLSGVNKSILVMETAVSFGDSEAINPVSEEARISTEAVSGKGCRPTRVWIMNTLKRLYEYVYVSNTQPYHEEFPLCWTEPNKYRDRNFVRAIFVASRDKIDNEMLSPTLSPTSTRHY